MPGAGCRWTGRTSRSRTSSSGLGEPGPDWNETGTQHRPGIQPADVRELLEHGAETVVLSKGVHERLGVCPETLQLLEDHGIEVEVLQTDDAVARYNELRASEPTGALIHSTC